MPLCSGSAFVIGLIVSLYHSISTSHSADVRDYCTHELFQPRCWQNEVIVITSAVYGRMKVGRCIKAVPGVSAAQGYLGCHDDVLNIIAEKCSGKPECDVRVVDLEIGVVSSCYDDLKKYLEVSYECIKVIKEDRSCVVPVSDDPQHIPGLSVYGCGTKTQPWILETQEGQSTMISIVDFTESTQAVSDKRVEQKADDDGCVQYGYIVDKSAKKNVSICGSETRRQELYLTESKFVEIVLTSMGPKALSTNSSKYSFLLRIEAVGCSDLRPPQDAWFKRQDNEAVVGCYSTRQTWHLKCRERKWTGVIGNCTQYLVEALVQTQTSIDDGFVVNLWIVIIICVTLAVCLSIACVGFVYFRRTIRHPDYENPSTANRYSYSANYWSGTKSHPTRNGEKYTYYPPGTTGEMMAPTYLMHDGCQTGASRVSTYTDDNRYFVLDRDAVEQDNLA